MLIVQILEMDLSLLPFLLLELRTIEPVMLVKVFTTRPCDNLAIYISTDKSVCNKLFVGPVIVKTANIKAEMTCALLGIKHRGVVLCMLKR